jgi:dihydroxy-acid dehydratase
LAAVCTGDRISVDAAARSIHLHLDQSEVARRLESWQPPARGFARGYGQIFAAHVRQADEGCDFDFLEGTARLPEPEIH